MLKVERDLFVSIGGYREALAVGENAEFQSRSLKHNPKTYVMTLRMGFKVHLEEFKTLSGYILRAYYYGRYFKKL